MFFFKKKTAHGSSCVARWQFQLRRTSKVGVPRPGRRVGAESLSDASCLRLPNPVSRARAAEIGSGLRAIGNKPSWILLQERNSKRKLPNKKKEKRKSTRDFAKGQTEGKRGEERATARRRISSPAASTCLRHRHHPKARYDSAACPRVGTAPRRAGGPCWGFGGGVGEGRPMLCGGLIL